MNRRGFLLGAASLPAITTAAYTSPTKASGPILSVLQNGRPVPVGRLKPYLGEPTTSVEYLQPSEAKHRFIPPNIAEGGIVLRTTARWPNGRSHVTEALLRK